LGRLQWEGFEAVCEGVGLDVHLLGHGEEQVAKVGLFVDRAEVDGAVAFVAFEVWGAVEVEVLAVSDAEFAAGEDDGEVGVAVAVAVGHTAAIEVFKGIQRDISTVSDIRITGGHRLR